MGSERGIVAGVRDLLGEQIAAIRPVFLEMLREEFGAGPVRLETEAHIGVGMK